MSDDEKLVGKTIVFAEIGGYGVKLKFSDGSILDYSSSSGGYSCWEIIDGTKQVERNGGKVGCPITCYEYDRIIKLPVISVPLKEEGAMTWYKNAHYTTAGIKETSR